MRRPSSLGVVLLLIVTACTTAGDVVATSAPTSPSTSSAPTTTTQSVNTTSGALYDSDYVYLVRVEAGTLKPIPEFEPLPMKDHLWGDVSPNGKWIAGVVWDYVEPIPTRYLRLIDVDKWKLVLDLPTLQDDPVLVDDDGSIYWTRNTGRQLRRIVLGSDQPEVVAEYPANFTSVGPLHMTSANWLYTIGATDFYEDLSGKTLLIGVDVATGELQTMKLENVLLGGRPSEDIEQQANVPFESFLPAVVWDESQNRALVVHADQDMVTEVDLKSGKTVEHTYTQEASLLDSLFAWLIPPAQAKGPSPGTERSAELSPDGRYLYVATKTGTLRSESENEWSVTTESLGIDMIDTTTWQIVADVDEAISTVWMSPDGQHLFGSGLQEFESSSSYDGPTCSDVYLFDARDLTQRLRVEATDWCEVSISFSADGRFAYLLNGSQLQTVDIIDLQSAVITDSLRHLGTRSPGGFSFWNPADVMGVPPGVAGSSP